MPVSRDLRGRARLPKVTSVAALCIGTAVLAGCGSSSPSATSAASVTTAQVAAQPSQPTPSASNADVGGEQSQHGKTRGVMGAGNVAKRSTLHVEKSGKVQRGYATAASSDDQSGSGAKPINPCTLVTRAEAGSITGRAVTASVEAPLGPTCIYKVKGSKTDITLAVEVAGVNQVARQMRKRTSLSVRGHTAYCGSLGLPTLVLPLSGGELLNVSAAPCGQAQRFASLALGRLAA